MIFYKFFTFSGLSRNFIIKHRTSGGKIKFYSFFNSDIGGFKPYSYARTFCLILKIDFNKKEKKKR